uniref:SGNH domain-containing protein n=1 Tax=Caenorhabditis tropicalis TaxID=1561998 RepID=A0A1I7TK90_9PELO
MKSLDRPERNTPSSPNDIVSRKRQRTHPETVSEKKSRLHEIALKCEEDITPAYETSNDNLENESKSTDTSHLNISTKATPVPANETNPEFSYSRGILLKNFFHDLIEIDLDFHGNKFYIVGDSDAAKRINKKFSIMQKLGILVGCGLDCHFRMAHEEYRSHGHKKICNCITIRRSCAVCFFDSILSLIPRNLYAAESIILKNLNEGNENDIILKFYDFLKNIRGEVFLHIATMPIIWTTDDFTSKDESHVDIVDVRGRMKQCGEKQLRKLENERPGYTNILNHVWGLGPTQNFEQMMEMKFNEFKSI